MASHVSCVTEHEKYAKGATKPGGIAANGFFGSDGGAGGAPAAVGGAAPASASAAASAGETVEGFEHLSTRFPWKCHLCNVTCTSQETLSGHASGLKHRRRARAAAKSNNQKGGGGGSGGEKEEEKEEGEKGDAAAAETTTARPSTPPQKGAVSQSPSKGEKKKDKKEKNKTKKRKQEEKEDDDDKGNSSRKKQRKQPKWKKLALSVLSSAESKKGIKIGKLQDAVLKAAGVGSAGDEAAAKEKEEALAAWRASGKFRVEGVRVSLA